MGLLLPSVPAKADVIRNQEWYLSYLHAVQAQKISDGKGIIVALIDTGVDATHRDLSGTVLPGVVTYAGSGRAGDAWHDPNGHGTGMAGNIAAHGHGASDGALGIAPLAKILPIADTVDAGRTSDIAMTDSIRYAIQHRVQVICLAQGGGGGTPDLTAAVQEAEEADIVVVAAVGNRSQGTLTVDAPADLPGVVAVASVDQAGNHVADSVTGPSVLLAAPGVSIVHPAPGGGYAEGTGTSDATAIVAGAVALVRSKYPNLSASEVIHRLTTTATDKGAPGRDPEYGYGVINILAALTADVSPLAASSSPAHSDAGEPTNNNSHSAAQPIQEPSAGVFVIIVITALVIGVSTVIGWRLARRRGS